MKRFPYLTRAAGRILVGLPLLAVPVLPSMAQTATGPETAPAREAGVVDLNSIIRSLAPIEYLPEHGGKPRARTVDLQVLFETNRATLRPEARAQLDELGKALKSATLKDHRFRIAGHTDACGPAAYNKALSGPRAASVAAYLPQTHGVAPARLEVAGFGEERLRDALHPNAAVNRRVEVSLIAPPS